MRLVWQLLVGVICGFFGAYLFLYIADIELAPYVTHLIIALYVVTFLSFI